MSLVIRLSKTGRKGESKYRVVVAEKRSARDGKAVESLGSYIKREKEKIKEVNKERYNYWISKGAKPTPVVEALMKT